LWKDKTDLVMATQFKAGELEQPASLDFHLKEVKNRARETGVVMISRFLISIVGQHGVWKQQC
jgi:hypothetical protein